MIKVVHCRNQEAVSAQLGEILAEAFEKFAADRRFALFWVYFSKLFSIQDLFQVVLVDGPKLV